MRLYTKFQEATKAVNSAALQVNIAKMAYNDELKKGEQDNTPHLAVGAGNKAKKLKKVEGDKSCQSAVVAAKAALNRA